MVARAVKPSGHARRVYLRPPRPQDAVAFVAAARASQRLHASWVTAPSTPEAYRRYVGRFGASATPSRDLGLLVVEAQTEALAGVFNFSEIVRGPFLSAYLGYYAFAGHARRGLMSEGLSLALDHAFRKLRLHRVEVNVQPSNRRSLTMVEQIGFTREGYSRRYVKVGGRWRDHVRYAMLAEDWAKLRARARASLALR